MTNRQRQERARTHTKTKTETEKLFDPDNLEDMTKQCTQMHQSSLLICFQIAFKRDLRYQVAVGHRLRQINISLSAWTKN